MDCKFRQERSTIKFLASKALISPQITKLIGNCVGKTDTLTPKRCDSVMCRVKASCLLRSVSNNSRKLVVS